MVDFPNMRTRRVTEFDSNNQVFVSLEMVIALELDFLNKV